MVGMFLKFSQPEPKLLTANVKETTVKSIGNVMANTKVTMRQSTTCAAVNDISHFQCFVMMHKLNFEFTSQTQ